MKTIIGGASIIDFMMLVVDSQKLIQTQTAECIVLGEILMDKLIIALNKVDLFPEGIKDPKLQAATKKLRGNFKNTKFGPFLPIVPVAATAT
jgi:selenocysteine-specific elongation factor